MPPDLHLIADDLTGALDTAAPFSTPENPVPVYLPGRLPPAMPRRYAVDSGTREESGDRAAAAAARLAGLVAPGPGWIAYKKLDSLLRGNPAREIAAILGAVSIPHCVIAPAFPFHGRVTRAGRQFARRGQAWEPVGENLEAALSALGLCVQRVGVGGQPPDGAPCLAPLVTLWDAETDGDLVRIARSAEGLAGPVLWCGSGGLASALAGAGAPALRDVPRPLLGIFGTDHPVTASQLEVCRAWVMNFPRDAKSIRSSLEQGGASLVTFDLPGNVDRPVAADEIRTRIAALTATVPRPRTLFVAGGETLRSLCLCREVAHLEVRGEALPGVPFSVLRGGPWDGVGVFSKSGAFGAKSLLQELLGL